MDDKPVK